MEPDDIQSWATRRVVPQAPAIQMAYAVVKTRWRNVRMLVIPRSWGSTAASAPGIDGVHGRCEVRLLGLLVGRRHRIGSAGGPTTRGSDEQARPVCSARRAEMPKRSKRRAEDRLPMQKSYHTKAWLCDKGRGSRGLAKRLRTRWVSGKVDGKSRPKTWSAEFSKCPV
jgi:hypothetical protein